MVQQVFVFNFFSFFAEILLIAVNIYEHKSVYTANHQIVIYKVFAPYISSLLLRKRKNSHIKPKKKYSFSKNFRIKKICAVTHKIDKQFEKHGNDAVKL